MIRLFSLVALVAACGDNVPAIPAQDYETAMATASCMWSVRCGLVDDLPTCLAIWPARPDPQWLLRVEAGKIKYDAVQAYECADVIANARCVPFANDRSSACEGISRGALDDGEPCASPDECLSFECNGAVVDGCYVGRCWDDEPQNPRIPLGESCMQYSTCLDGYCDAVTSRCVPWLRTGAACTESLQCASRWCTDQTCTELPGTGDPCLALADGRHYCGNYGDHCDLATLTCVPDGLSGDPCTSSYECAPWYACADGICRLRPREGEPCDATGNDSDRTCLGDLACVAGVCTGEKPDGASCTTFSECASNYCDATHVCAQAPICI